MKKNKKKKESSVLRLAKTTVSVFSIIFLLYIFTFYIDGEIGIILIAFLVIPPVISLVTALYSRDRLNVGFDCDGYVKAGIPLDVRVSVMKTSSMPLSLIEISPEFSEVFEKNEKCYKMSMISRNEKTFVFKVNPVVGGNGEIRVKSVYSCGFMGFMKFRFEKNIPLPKSIGVIPEIPEIKTSSQLFRSIADVVVTSDDDEDSDTAMLHSANTAPGYEHREYIQGDPLKRINWKLSSKKMKLMVRLDEAVASVQPLIVLDLFRNIDADPAEAVLVEEKLLVSVFALLSLLVKQGIACNFSYYGNSGEIVTESVDNPDYPMQLLLKVLAVKVVPDRRISISQQNASACACIVATTSLKGSFASIVSNIENPESSCILTVSGDTENPTELPLWYLDDSNNFKRV